jgi:hypothetical protein
LFQPKAQIVGVLVGRNLFVHAVVVLQNSKIAQISTGGALQLLTMIPEIEFGARNPQISSQLLFSNRAM